MANVSIFFENGMGRLTAQLMRNGTAIADGSVTATGNIAFPAAQLNDTIVIDGVCTGTATITIDALTTPVTPVEYPAGNIFGGFDL